MCIYVWVRTFITLVDEARVPGCYHYSMNRMKLFFSLVIFLVFLPSLPPILPLPV